MSTLDTPGTTTGIRRDEPPALSLVETFQAQLSELELMQSMYPKDGEFTMADPTALVDVSDYVHGRTTELPSSRLEYRVNLRTLATAFEVSCTLPHVGYPSMTAEPPQLTVRSQRLNRTQQRRLNDDAQAVAVEAQGRGESCVMAVLQWVSDKGDSYVDVECPESEAIELSCKATKGVPQLEDRCLEQYLDRYWIYSHHIYNKTKRRDILQLANDLDISGFCLPGKPGIVCAEGSPANCAHFWDRLKHMSWKKIVCKKMEREQVGHGSNGVCDLRRFPALSEVTFQGGRAGAGGNGRVDFGAFFAYLEERNCGHIFKDYFGVDGRLASDDHQATTT